MKTLYTIGIDFGTSNSCVAYATYYDRASGDIDPDPIQRPEALSFQHRETVPTVMFLGDGREQQPLFGEACRGEVRLLSGVDTIRASSFALAALKRAGKHSCSASSSSATCGSARPRWSRWTARKAESGSRPSWAIRCSGPPTSEKKPAGPPRKPDFRTCTWKRSSMAALYSHLCEDKRAFQPKPGSRILMVDMGAARRTLRSCSSR